MSNYQQQSYQQMNRQEEYNTQQQYNNYKMQLLNQYQQHLYQFQKQYKYPLNKPLVQPLVQQPVQQLVQQPVQQPVQQITNKDIYDEKRFVFDTIIRTNSGITFGNYVVQKIISNYQTALFKKQIKEVADSNKIILTQQLEDKHFYNKAYLPQLKSRLKMSNHIEILIYSNQCELFLRNIVRAFAKDGYTLEEIHRGDITKIYEYSSLELDANIMFLNTINITVKIGYSYNFTIKLNMFIANIQEYVPLKIPYGLFTTEKSYMTLSYDYNLHNEIFEIPAYIANTEQSLMKIQKNITTYMPFYNYSKLSGMLESIGSSSYTIDFNLSNGKYSDFTITNIYNKHKYYKTDNHPEHPCCSKCNTDILPIYSIPSIQNPNTNPYYKQAITKCCGRKYHFECLFENYVEDGNFKCDHCGIIISDTLGKNKEILMCLTDLLD